MSAIRPDTKLERREVYVNAITFIVANHARPLTVDDVARHTLTSSRQLQRVLCEEGVGFRRLVLRARMGHAAKLLRAGTPTCEVARRVGYLDAAGFCKAFRGFFGCSPGAWRRAERAADPVG